MKWRWTYGDGGGSLKDHDGRKWRADSQKVQTVLNYRNDSRERRYLQQIHSTKGLVELDVRIVRQQYWPVNRDARPKAFYSGLAPWRLRRDENEVRQVGILGPN